MIKTSDRTYLETHPWITFHLDLRKANHRMWLLLGDAQAKCTAIQGIPLLPRVSQQLYHVFVAKGVLGTTAIEGNTLSEEEVIKLLEGELELPPSKEYLGKEVGNIIQACNLIRDRVMRGQHAELCVDDIQEFNRLVFKDLPKEEDFEPGEFRQHDVRVGRYKGTPPQDCDYLIHKLCDWLNSTMEMPSGYETAINILRAIIAHLYIAWIHPFGNGNGRTARLIEFEILLAAGLPDAAAHLLSNHYNQTRTEYYRHLEISHRVDDGVLVFIEYALQGFVDGLNAQLEMVKDQQLHVHWINYIHDQFKDKDSASDVRLRRLAIDLSYTIEPVVMSEVRHISPRIAESYAGLTDKTFSRDVKKLEDMGLILRTSDGVRSNREVMKAFMPARIA